MKRLNLEFFDEFKELDNLCIDLFGEVHGKRGVTLYIETMEKNARRGEAKVEGWVSDLRQLKAARHSRNQLAHSKSSFSGDLCTKEQLEFLRSFKARVQKGTDPISLLRGGPEKKKTHGSFGKIFASIFIFLIIALIIAFLVKFFVLK